MAAGSSIIGNSGLPKSNSNTAQDILGQLMPGANKLLPGLDNLTQTATGNVANLLEGLPSPDSTRTSNAYFGIESGMPGSEFVRNRGYDLYNQKAEGRQQTGLQNLLQLIGGYSNAFLPTPGQLINNQQFGQQLGQQGSQFQQTNALDQNRLGLQFLQAMMSGLG